MLKTLKQPKTQKPKVDWALALEEATVTVEGYFYRVDFGPQVQPCFHTVGKDRTCRCSLGKTCPAVQVVADYLRNGGERAPDPPDGYYPVPPLACPICGAETVFEPRLSSRRRGVGWRCKEGGTAHYWEDRGRISARNARREWLFPPVKDAEGRVLYPGVRLDDLIIAGPDYRPNFPADYTPYA